MGGEVTQLNDGEYYYWEDSVYDYSVTPTQGCTANSSSGYMNTATYADFMGEANPGEYGLPDFYGTGGSGSGMEVFDGYYYSGGNAIEIDNSPVSSTSSSIFDYIDATTNNNNYTYSCNTLSSLPVNVCPTEVSSGAFDETWETSDGI